MIVEMIRPQRNKRVPVVNQCYLELHMYGPGKNGIQPAKLSQISDNSQPSEVIWGLSALAS